MKPERWMSGVTGCKFSGYNICILNLLTNGRIRTVKVQNGSIMHCLKYTSAFPIKGWCSLGWICEEISDRMWSCQYNCSIYNVRIHVGFILVPSSHVLQKATSFGSFESLTPDSLCNRKILVRQSVWPQSIWNLSLVFVMTLSKCAHAEQDHEIGAILQRCDIGEHTLYALGTYGWTAGWTDGWMAV